MGYTLDIDTGGTFTDGFFARGEEFRAVKTPTTPHDLTVCFLDCFKAGADAFGVSLGELLHGTDVVRFCTTIGTNCIIQRDGAKIGLLMTRGHEALAPASDLDGKAPLVSADMVIGVQEEVAADGALRRRPDPAEALDAAQALIDRGARCLVVALAGSDVNPINERSIREFIKREYPRDYLGSVPVFLASDISARPGYRERVNTAVLNAYIHGKLTRLLYSAGEQLRRNQYGGHLFIGHNNGAVARVAKTRAIQTYNSGPVAGLLGAREVGALYGARCVVSADMGGTSFDIGCVVDGEAGYTLRPEVEGFPCNLPMLSIRALGAGGGSIATVRDGRLAVGPESAGALPGPACFDLGGCEATVTDAALVLGLLDPDYFLGGRKRLDIAKARSAIAAGVAKPLGLDLEEAALGIKDVVEQNVAREICRLLEDTGADLDPVMVLHGGAGPLHGCAVADRVGIRRLIVTPFSAVFSAYASSLMDVGHVYYRRSDVPLRTGSDFSSVASAIEDMRAQAERDMRGEGFARESLGWLVELIARSERLGQEVRITAAADFHRHPEQVAEVAARAARAFPGDGKDVTVSAVGLLATARISHFTVRRSAPAREPVAGALKRARAVHTAERAVSVPVYDRSRLRCGHRLVGPALVESEQTTIWVTPGWTLAVDEYDNAILEKATRQ